MKLQTKNESETVLDIFEELASYPAGEFYQTIAVDGDELRYIGHRVFGQACSLGRKQDVTWGIYEPSIGAQHDGNDRVDATPVEGVALHNQDGPVVPGLGAVGFAEIGPPDLTAVDYHVLRASERLCSCLRERGSRLSSDP